MDADSASPPGLWVQVLNRVRSRFGPDWFCLECREVVDTRRDVLAAGLRLYVDVDRCGGCVLRIR